MKNFKPLISSLYILLAVIISIPLTAQLPTIDGHYCETAIWGPPGGSDGCGDESSAPADFKEGYFIQDGDILYVGWERCANGSGTATYALLFDADCDGNADAAVYVEWGSQGGSCQSNVDVFLHPGCNAGKTVIGSGITGTPLCPGGVPDCSEAGKFLEFSFDIQDVIAGLIICNDYDPCDCTCGEVSLLGAVTLAGGSPNSSVKDDFDSFTFTYDSAGNKCPTANMNIASASICVGAPVNFNGDGSTDPKPHPADLNLDYAWNFGDGGTSTDSTTTHTYTTAGTYLVELTVTDVFGCIDMVTQNVTVLDDIPPVINTCAADLILECDEDYTAEIATWISNSNSTILSNTTDDRPATLSVMNDYVAPPDLSCDLSSGALITFTVTDDCGNTTSCAATIFIDDSTVPTITCPDNVTVAYDATCLLDTMTTSIGVPIIVDACGTPSYSYSDDTAGLSGCNSTGSFTRTFVAIDDCGNTSSCVQTVTVIDDINPTITCPANVTVAYDATCMLAIDPILNTGEPTLADNCGTSTYTFADVNSLAGCNGTGTITRTFTVDDGCGNTATCEQIITVIDDILPVVTCPDDITLAYGPACDVDTDPVTGSGEPTMTDNCGTPSYTFTDINDFTGCNNTGTITRTFTVDDGCGNTATCEQTITLIDDTLPTIACPLDATVFFDGSCGLDVDPITITGEPTMADNCGTPTYTFVDVNAFTACNGTGIITRTFTADDGCGNTASCQQIITIQDNTNPVLIAPSDVTVECGSEDVAIWIALASSTDNCDAVVDITNAITSTSTNCGATSATNYLFTATDDCGNTATAVATYTIEDTSIPLVTCPTDLTLECGDPNNAVMIATWLASASGSDPSSCSGFTISDNYDGSSLPTPCGGMLAVMFSIVDDCGNVGVDCIANIILEDNTPPIITNCPVADITVFVDPMECGSEVNISLPNATDSCDPSVTVTQTDGPPGNIFPLGSTMVEFTATDACGNTDICIYNIVVEDNEAPSLSCPADFTVCVDPGTCTWVADNSSDITYMDNCIDAMAINMVGATGGSMSGTLAGQILNIGVNTIIYTVTDLTGNTASCSVDITVSDCDAPTFTCPSDITVECDGLGNMVDFDTWSDAEGILATVVENCPGVLDVNVTLFESNPSCGGSFTSVYLFEVSDAAGNSNTCLSSFTVADTDVPTMDVVPADITIECDANASDNLADWLDMNAGATASDVCNGPLTWSNNYTTGDALDCTGAGTDVTFTVQDDCGNSVTAIANFLILDSAAPVITCPADLTIECADPLEIALTDAFLNGATATDNCDSDITITNDYGVNFAPSCSSTGIHTVIFTATDDCGNASTCEAFITINDTTNPIITCPPAVTVSYDSDCGLAIDPILDTGEPVMTDACGTPSYTFADTPDLTACNNTGTITRTFVSDDGCGNTSSCAQVITVIDDTNPVILCPDDITVNFTGTCMLDTTLTNIGSPIIMDNCGTPTFTYTDNTTGLLGCNGSGSFTRTFVADDGCGNTAICIQTVTVQDVSAPMVDCPGDITVFADENCDFQIDPVLDTGEPISTDNCGTPTYTYTDVENFTACNGTGMITRTFVLDDGCGNTTPCEQIITLIDNTKPTIVCPGDVSVYLNASCMMDTTTVDTGLPTVLDNCGTPVVTYTNDLTGLSGCNGSGSFTRTFLVDDGCGNTASCTQTIAVMDLEIPTITCPVNVTVSLSESCVATIDTMSTGSPTVDDNCDTDPTITFSDDNSGLTGCNGTGTIVRTFIVEDACANTAKCMQVITIIDDILPTITCPADVTVAFTGSCLLDTTLVDIGQPIISDNCPGSFFTYEDDLIGLNQCNGTGMIFRTFRVEDGCGQMASCMQKITVIDNTNPVITCPADVTVQFSATCLIDTTLVDIGSPMITDNCGTPTFIYADDITGLTGCSGTGTFTRTFIADDGCGNTASCVQTVTVENNVIPSITCPADLTVQLDGTCMMDTTTATIGFPMVSGGCGVNAVTYVNDLSTLTDCNGTGFFTRTFTVDDGCGNSSSCSQVITVIDDTNPVIVCPLDVTVSLTGTCTLDTLLTDLGSPVITDNCGVPIFTYVNDLSSLTACNGTGFFTRTFTVDDGCGNTASCTQTISVVDDTNPVIVCPADVTVQFSATCLIDTTLADIGSPMITDNCGTPTFIYADDITGLTGCSGTGTFTRTFIADDGCGNTASCVQTVTVENNVIPSITCPADLTVQLDGTCMMDTTKATIGFPMVSGGCGVNAVTYVNDLSTLTDCNGTGFFTRTFTVDDGCGNSSSCSQVITVIDDTNPVIVCPLDVTVSLTGTCTLDTLLTDLGSPVITDNCGVPIFTYVNDLSSLTACNGTGFFTRTFTVDDGCGNTASCTQTISVVDDTNPMIVCPADVTVFYDATCILDTMPATIGIPVVSDNCDATTFAYSDDISGLNGCGGNTGTVARTWTVTDACDNTAICIQNIQILDILAPVFTVDPMDTLVVCGPNILNDFNTWLSNFGGGSVMDNCSSISTYTNPTVPTLMTDWDVDGNTSVWFVAEDACGNKDSIQATFNVSCINAAKAVSSVVPATTTGNFNVTYSLVVENTGNVNLNNISLIDVLDDASQLGTAFVMVVGDPTITASTATTDPMINVNYDGMLTNPDMLDGMSGLLLPGEMITIQIVVEVDPDAIGAPSPMQNQATASGDDPDGNRVTDDSDSGTDPESNNPIGLGNTGGSNDPTPLPIPNINVAKEVAGYVEASSGTNGNFDVTYSLVIGNTGNVDLNNISLEDVLDASDQLGSSFVMVVGDPTIVGSTATTDPKVNVNYDGLLTNPDMLDGLSGLLETNQTITIEIVIEVDPNAAGAPSPLQNQATASGDDPSGVEVNDDSDSGADPTGDNPGEPGDTGGSDDPTPLTIPEIGVAKTVASVVPATTTGNFNVIYTMVIENLGNVNLNNISLIDVLDDASQLGTAFVMVVGDPTITASTATTDPMINVNYDGMLTNPDMLDGMSGLLLPGEMITIQIVVEVDPDAIGAPSPMQNQATASGDDPDGNRVTDDSDSGTDPESDNMGEPGDTGGEDDPTPLPIPNINLAKEVAGYVEATSGTNGNFDVTYSLVIGNTGNVDLNNISLEDVLDAPDQLGSSFVMVVGDPTIVGSTATTDPIVNVNYDGLMTNPDMLDGLSGLLETNQTITIEIVIEVDPNAAGAPSPLQNQATASGDDPSGVEVNDDSDSGADPSGDNPGEPGDTGRSDDPTPLTIPEIGVAKTVASVVPATTTGNFNVTYTMVIENLGNVNLNNISLEDVLDDASQLGTAFVMVVGDPTITASTATTDPIINVNYDGMLTNPAMLDGVSGLLVPGETITIQIVVEVDPDATGVPSPMQNQATASGDDPDGNGVSDDSDSGTDPESDNMGEPGDTGGEDDPTPLPIPNINLVKEVAGYVEATSGTNGNFDVTYSLVIGNTGNVDLNNISLEDVLDAPDQLGSSFVMVVGDPTIVGSTATTDPIVNVNYDGLMTNPDMLDGLSGLLETNQTITIEIVVEVDPNAAGAPSPLQNQATASGDDPSGVEVNDDSDSGADPTGDNPGEPGDTGGSDDPTPLTIPEIGVAKTVASVVPATTTGNFNVIYTMVIENLGNVNLNNISLIDVLDDASQLGTAFVMVVGDPTITASTATTDPMINVNYDGMLTNPDMLDGMSGLLLPGEMITIQIVVEVDPDAIGAPSPMQNQATASGDDPDGNRVTDDSDSGTDPESDNMGEPGDTGGEDDPTPLMIPSINAAKTVVGFVDAVSGTVGNLDVTFGIYIQNTGNQILDNITFVDDIASQFGSTFVTPPVPVISNISLTGSGVLPTANPSYDGGITNDSILLYSSGGILNPADVLYLEITVEVDPNAIGAPDPLENQGTVTGTDNNGTTVNDDTDSGIDPDGTNPNAPGDTGSSDDPTPILLPNVSLLKNLVSYEDAASGIAGEFDIVMQIGMANIGNTNLGNLDLFDQLDSPTNFDIYFAGIAPGFAPFIANSTAATNPTLNGTYDGTIAQPNLFDGMSGLLEPGQIITVELRFALDGSIAGIPDTLYNLALGGGSVVDENGDLITDENGDPITTEDESDSGTDFEGTNPDAPGDMGTSDDPTPVPLLGSISGTVWKDVDGNGIQDGGELGVQGAIATLYDCNDNFIETILSDQFGNYEFDLLIPGDYYVDFDLPSGEVDCDFTLQDEGIDDALDSDVDINGIIECFAVAPAEDVDVDAGLLILASIGDYVWDDLDRNGIQDGNEPPIGNVQLNLYDDGGILQGVTYTDATGFYIFKGLYPGDYYLEFVPPTNYESTYPNQGSDNGADSDMDGSNGPYTTAVTNLESGEYDQDWDAGFYPCQELGGMVFYDLDNDGCQEVGEDAVTEIVTVNLYACDASGAPSATPVATTTTINGAYEFGPESPNAGGEICLDPVVMYYVEFILPDGDGEALEHWNFSSNAAACSEVRDASDVDGATGVTNCYNPLNDDNDDMDDDKHVDAGIYPCREIAGEVFDDENNNGCQDNDEILVSEAVTVTLYECGPGSPVGGTAVTSTTTIDGAYEFGPESPNQDADVCLDPAKEYLVVFTIPNEEGAPLEGYLFTQGLGGCGTMDTEDDVDPATGGTFCYNPVDPEEGSFDPGNGNQHIDAGIINRGKLCGRIWNDCNGDGIRNDGGAGIVNVQVDVYKEDGAFLGSAITDATGYYILENLIPGNYYIKVNKPDGFSATDFRQGLVLSQDSDLDDSNGDCTTPSSYVGPGDCDPGAFDAGLYECIPIGELVWYDINENDVHDSFENGINGLQVELWKQKNGVWSLYETQFTGHKPGTQSDDGYFKFCAPPGTYEIRVDLPSSGLVPTVKNVGTNGGLDLTDANESTTDSDVNFNQTTGSFTVNCNTGDVCNIGAGYYPMAQVGNRVWYDANNDGLQSASENGVAGVQVKAYNSNDEMVSESVTDSNGEYMVQYLGKDEYYLKFTPPSGYGMTIPNAGGNDAMDSDVDGSNGPGTTDVISLNPGDDLPEVDAGLVFGVVPVEWLSFEGIHRGNYNDLDWSTASEINASHFEIERSLQNTLHFVEIGKVVASGNSSEVQKYEMRDYDVEETGVYYYRLKQVDYNGNYSYSNTISIRIDGGGKDGIDMYPNPAVNEFTIDVTVAKRSEVAVSIWDATGQLIINNVLNEVMEAGTYQKAVDIKTLPAGMYNVKVTIENTVYNKKLLKVD